MTRGILNEANVHKDALKKIENYHQDVVNEVISNVMENKVVIVGMRQNPVVKKARKLLKEANIPYKYLSYGSYFSMWKPRLAIKLWSGWPTFPQVFIDGVLIGGAVDLEAYLKEKNQSI